MLNYSPLNLIKHLLNRRTASILSNLRARSTGLRPLSFLMFVEAPCCSRTLMTSVEFQPAARWRGVMPLTFRAFTSAPLCNSTLTTYVLLFHDARWSAVQPNSSRLSTGIPVSNISTTRLTSPRCAASWKHSTSDESISMKRMNNIKITQLDFCRTYFYYPC